MLAAHSRSCMYRELSHLRTMHFNIIFFVPAWNRDGLLTL